ncbi:MAG: copper homeostasis protein CutC [Saprospiraceae bacterium]
MVVEIACNQWISCVNAYLGGANRIELFENLPDGGCTPSYGMIQKVKEEIQLPLYVMIRPRGGDFIYTSDELNLMLRDISICKTLGVDGIVFGVLNKDLQVDLDACKLLLDTWQNPNVTFHRAFDQTNNMLESIEKIIQLGFQRILTSGGKENVDYGKETIKTLQNQYGNDIILMPGGGVTPANGRSISNICGTNEIHATCKTFDNNKQTYFSSIQCVQNLVTSFF